ncbi:MAG: heavy metal-binding domain-containing protein [Mucilaginibacter sp.]|uniref:heavy metal-binding domain-containing protein n=1 Tax=Mucilaginibacter sp. TaxID=1882438 RepID=UPI003266B4EC
MKNIIIVIGLLLFTTACNSNQKARTKTPADTAAKKSTGIQYTCTMHPDVIESKPGTCPKCGMQLVEKDNSK